MSSGRVPGRSSSSSASSGIATWSKASQRYFAINEDSGSDSNSGFSDADGATAMANAVKTWAQLDSIIPAVGDGRYFVLLVKPRANGADYSTNPTIKKTGYRNIIIRGSHDGANTALERKICGFVDALTGGINVAYTVTGGTSSTQFTTSATLPAADSLAGCRIRWDESTLTAGLQGWTSAVYSHTSGAGATIVQNQWGGSAPTPQAGDTFYIEKPGWSQSAPSFEFDCLLGKRSVQLGWTLAGMNCSGTGHVDFTVAGGYCIMSGIHAAATYFLNFNGLVAQPTYDAEDDSVIRIGVGMRTTGDYKFELMNRCILNGIFMLSTSANHGFARLAECQIGDGSSRFFQVPRIESCGYPNTRTSDTSMSTFGTLAGNQLPTRIDGGTNTVDFIDGSNIGVINVSVVGVASPGLRVTGNGTSIQLSNVTGNALSGSLWDFTRLRGGNVFFDGANGLTSGSGYALMPGSVTIFNTNNFSKVGFIEPIGGNTLIGTAGLTCGAAAIAKNKGTFQLLSGMSMYYDGSAVDVMARSSASATASALCHGIVLTETDLLGTANQLFYLAPPGGCQYVLNTSNTLAAGAIAYLSTTAGIVTSTLPSAGNRQLRVGTFANGTSGTDGKLAFVPEQVSSLI